MHAKESDAGASTRQETLGARGRKPMSTHLWTVPRVEVPTRLGLVVIALRRGRAVIVDGKGRLTPIGVPAHEANLLEPAREAMLLTPKDGREYLLAVAEANPGAVYRSNPSEVLERRPLFRRRGRTSATLLPATGRITVHGEMSDAGRRWLSECAVPSLRREWRRHIEEMIREARR
jgi:hypothetical protein